MGLGLLVIVGGLVSLFLGFSAQRRDAALKRWPSTPGYVIAREVVRTKIARLRTPVYSHAPSPEPSYRMDDVWALAVEYRYSVGGREYVGHRATSSLLVENIRHGAGQPSAALQAIAARIPVGEDIEVHFRPNYPSESYLVFIDSPGKPRSFQIGLLCVALGAAIIVVFRFFRA